MSNQRPPTIDPVAAQRWAHLAPVQSPWLHEEVARRMEARLDFMAKKPARWVHWAPLQGGLQAQGLLAARYPQSQAYVVQDLAKPLQTVKKALQPRWWDLPRKAAAPVFARPEQPVHMLWANMALHMDADPVALIRQWHALLDVDGFLMFSCLGPDTLRALRGVYDAMGWPAPSHDFTDMHDWGDMLVHNGFAEPVVDMERITLSFSSPQSLLQELRSLGRNLHPRRFGALRGKTWLAQLHQQLQDRLISSTEPGRMTLEFEIIYGHAFKSAPRLPVAGQSSITLEEMRQALGAGKAAIRRPKDGAG